MRIIKLIKSIFENFYFSCDNWLRLRTLHKVKITSVGEISFRGMLPSDERQVVEIYYQLNGGAKFTWPRRWLYRLVGSKLMLVAVKQEVTGDKVVGINMYYLNKRDIAESTIHEGFIGVLPEITRLGIATNLRLLAKNHFFVNGFSGISTRISSNNSPSMKSALKVGFKPVEKYFDAALNEDRFYMICDLERNQ